MNDKKKWVFDPDRFDGACITVMSDGLHSDYGGETLDELQLRYGNSRLQALGWPETSNVFKVYEKKLQRAFEEITEEVFPRMLGELPPARMIQGGFFFGEAYYARLYTLYFTRNGRYYCGLRDITSSDAALFEEIDKYIETI